MLYKLIITQYSVQFIQKYTTSDIWCCDRVACDIWAIWWQNNLRLRVAVCDSNTINSFHLTVSTLVLSVCIYYGSCLHGHEARFVITSGIAAYVGVVCIFIGSMRRYITTGYVMCQLRLPCWCYRLYIGSHEFLDVSFTTPIFNCVR